MSLVLSLGACEATSSKSDDAVVLRTQGNGTVVTTVELADGSVRTVLADAAGDERAEATRDATGEFSGHLDGEPWAPEGLDLLELDALHDMLHEIGAALPELDLASTPAGKADGATDAVVPGYYWILPDKSFTLNSCDPPPLSDGVHEYTGEELVYWAVSEITEVTATSYVERRWITQPDGSLAGLINDPTTPHQEFSCVRAGPTFGYCTQVSGPFFNDLNEAGGINQEEQQMQIWDRDGGGFRRPFVHLETGCSPQQVTFYGSDTPVELCQALLDFGAYERFPCHHMWQDEARPTELPLLDVP